MSKTVRLLTGQGASDVKLLERCDIVISTPENWDILSRRWRQRKQINNVKLFIVDEVHLLGESGGVLETIVSRMRYIASSTENSVRFVGLATSVANYRDIAEWIGASYANTFNFLPNVRPSPLEIYIQGFDQNQRSARLLNMSNHIYHGIKVQARNKPVIIFVSDRKQARLTALDMVTFAASDNNPKRFLHLPSEDIQQYLESISEKTLKHVLTFGVGFIYEGMDEGEREVVEKLYEADAIQLLICTYRLCWEISLEAYIVVIMDTQRYDGQERRYVDYSIPDMLQMMGRAGRPRLEEPGKCLVFCHTPKRDFYKKFLYEPFPVESHLNHFITDHINAEVVSKTIENKQDCVDWITWTFLYRRLTQNPNYYNLQGTSGTQINDYLSEIIENTVEELANAKCISVEEEMDLQPMNLGIIASYYYIHSTTIDTFSKSINETTKLKQLIEILSAATEFENVQIRHGEEEILRQLCTETNFKVDKPVFNEPNTKSNILLQTYFGRTPINSDLTYDQKIVVEQSTRLIQAMVDVISSSGWLKPAILAMQLSQMIVQAMWISDSQLHQLPYFTKELVDKCREKQINDLADLMQMEDEERIKLLNLSDDEIAEVAKACNRYPNLTVEHKIKNQIVTEGDNVVVEVKLTRDEELDSEIVYAPNYPKPKEEFWWVIIGDAKNNKLFAIKRVNFPKELKIDVKFTAPETGDYELHLYTIFDSYVGVDQGEKFKLSVGAKPEGEGDGDEEQRWIASSVSFKEAENIKQLVNTKKDHLQVYCRIVRIRYLNIRYDSHKSS
eukprot:TRINITY_DN744_c0_g1_i15.p1 TRINITY_DN744_c0_g1~~TRINITY_DN744_c0_g1_i15.p1  ORF type:complete len:788 (+),score=90.05 TRINITY_DN744_c0_g1_i15:1-2364(+)